jgi:hypothetical protein
MTGEACQGEEKSEYNKKTIIQFNMQLNEQTPPPSGD